MPGVQSSNPQMSDERRRVMRRLGMGIGCGLGLLVVVGWLAPPGDVGAQAGDVPDTARAAEPRTFGAAEVAHVIAAWDFERLFGIYTEDTVSGERECPGPCGFISGIHLP